jgi:hypothetical protein
MYHLLHNLDARFSRPYQCGDRLADGYVGQVTISDLDQLAEVLYDIHIRDDRPDGRSAPSLSVGDVIVVGETAVSVDRSGFVVVAVDPADLLGVAWLETRH